MISIQDILCRIEKEEPRAKAVLTENNSQIVVSFTNRPDVELTLLTPFHQKLIRMGKISKSDVDELMYSVKNIANWPLKSDSVSWHIRAQR